MDYEQRYNELVNAVKILKETNPSDEGIQNWVNENVPELAESKDERIRKAIICYIGYGQHCGVSNIDMIAWLEKQNKQILANSAKTCKDEQKPIIEMKSPEESLGISSEEYNDIVNECVYGEQNPTDKVKPKFKVGDTIRLKNSLAEFTIENISDGRYYFKGSSIDIIACDRDYYKLAVPKHSNVESIGEDWSEEDERIYHSLLADIRASQDGSTNTLEAYYNEQIDWLKSLKERVQPKQEWSEEDEKEWKSIVSVLTRMHFLDELDWLRSKLKR